MSYAIVGLLFVMLVVCVALAAKTWHWVNLVFVVLIFMVGVGAAVATAQVYKLRQTDLKAADVQEKRVERLKKLEREAVSGPDDSPNYGPKSLRSLSNRLSTSHAGRGRVWTGGQIEKNGNNRVFKFSVTREELDGGGTMQDMVLFVFSEGQVQVSDTVTSDDLYPIGFVGEVRVVNEGADSVELEAIFVANEQEFAEPSVTWTVFEKMPLDRNDVFSNAERIKPSDFNITEFRQVLVEKHLPAGLFGLDPNGAEYEKLIDREAFDGVAIGKIESWLKENKATRIVERFEPKPEEVFVLYEFTKKSRDYEVDASGSLADDGLFTALGRAIPPSLHAGGPVKFAKGDTVYVDLLNADGYQRPDGTQVPAFNTTEEVNEVDRVYVRELRDYPFILRELKRDTARFVTEIKRVKANNETTQTSLDDAQSQIIERDTVISGLQVDQGNLTKDAAGINKLELMRRQEMDQTQASLTKLEKEVDENYKKLRREHRYLESNMSKKPKTNE